MKYFEYGKELGEIMVILHGGGTYDGFNPSEPETEFVSPTSWGYGIIRT